MATVSTVCMAIQVREFRHSTSGSNWSLILNTGGVDVLSIPANTPPPFGSTSISFAREFPPEGFARVYLFGTSGPPLLPFQDLVRGTFTVDTAMLSPSSARVEFHGEDLLRSKYILVWGLDAGGAVVPIALDSDLPNLSDDMGEGRGSIPLTLVDSGDNSTPLTEVFLYVALTENPNSRTGQPVSFRVERANGQLVWSSGLDDFSRLESDGHKEARIWTLTEATPFSRVDAAGAVVPKLRVDGPDNAMIKAVVAFGVNRDGPRPLVVPLVHHAPSIAGTNPWVGRSTDPQGAEMVLPLCAMASRQ